MVAMIYEEKRIGNYRVHWFCAKHVDRDRKL